MTSFLNPSGCVFVQIRLAVSCTRGGWMKAYMFINVAHGQALALTESIRRVRGVEDADALTGEFDAVATLQARDMGELRASMTDLQRIEGVLNTTTCIVLT